MIHVDVHSLTQPVGVLRLLAIILTCVTFSLVASAGYVPSPYWAWCMFTWCFCFFFTLLVIVLDFTTFSGKLPFAWDDFTTAFAMLASLMCLAAAIIYPVFFTCQVCHRQIGASVVAWACLGVYVGEVTLTRLRPGGQINGFLSTLPGLMKMLEVFLACLTFTSLEKGQYADTPELQWCVAVFSLCFILAMLIILLTGGQLTSRVPFFDKMVIVYDILAAVTYMTAVVIWPLYSFPNNARPPNCGYLCSWDKLVMVTIMTLLNFCVYTVDCVYSIRLVLFVSSE
ncbi:myeloid-associated differentiation marker-like [Dunckerocampus dactyliophorus]|uniref:myeloid-associated differentiation marker-like n=1 Tax=Dunckerocampus dactyliophorus TaxID=161453 RepID=UPI0024060063|nr:myeloid-associated differentiation marker-like [Dunckerocampus dactyliophorus]